MKYTKEHVETYLETKKEAWAKTTIVTARAKLNSVVHLMACPASFHASLVELGYKPYSVKQYFVIVSKFASSFGDDSYSQYVTAHAQAFKNAYAPKVLEVTFDEAKRAIDAIGDKEHARQLKGLLQSGLRISEPLTLDVSGAVVGKGGKLRKAPNADKVVKAPMTKQIRRALKEATGLVPHDLRKLFATQAVAKGAQSADLCKLMGWSSIETAMSYLQATKADDIANQIGSEE